MRIVHDNSISKSDCDFIIQEYERRGPSDRWCNSDHLTFRPKNFSENQRMLDILNKIASVTGYDIDWGEIVKRPQEQSIQNIWILLRNLQSFLQ